MAALSLTPLNIQAESNPAQKRGHLWCLRPGFGAAAHRVPNSCLFLSRPHMTCHPLIILCLCQYSIFLMSLSTLFYLNYYF